MFKKFLALMLALLMVTVVLVGCGTNNTNIDETSETNEQNTLDGDEDSETKDTEKAPETDDETGESDSTEDTSEPTINVFVDGKIIGDIVISDKASDVISRAGNELKDAISEELKVDSNLRKEGTFKTLNNGTLDVPKIVVGKLSGDPYCETLMESLTDNDDHVIVAKNGTLYIIGKTDATTAVAVNKFISFYVRSGKPELIFNEGQIEDDITAYKGLKVNGTPIVDYSIVTYDSYYARALAGDIQAAIKEKIGLTLPVVSEKDGERQHEILVGKTSRAEAKEIRRAYDRPNVYYDVKAVNSKLVIMGEGYWTLTKIGNILAEFVGSADATANISGSVLSGNILADVDAIDCMTEALEKSDSVDMRVFHWNLAAPLSWSQTQTAWGENWPFPANDDGRSMRGEMQADMILIYNPDIITTNEIYDKHAGGVQFRAFKTELSEYFTEIDSQYDTRDDDLPVDVPDTPLDANPEKIFIRKGKFNVVDSGWRHLSDGASYHGVHWAVLENIADGKKFITSVGHYGDATKEVTYAAEHLSAVNFAMKCSGSSTMLPVILTGDMFTWINHSGGASGAGYYYHESKGYSDSQVSATLNCNDEMGIKHGTYHDPMNDSSKARASEDFVWYNNQLVSSKFGVIATPETTNTSDHWPVFADLSFKGSEHTS